MKKEMSRSRKLGLKVLYSALQILKENDGKMKGSDVLALIEKRVELDTWARERYERTGYIRWQSILRFYSIPASKAGYLVKQKGIWYLTPEGEKALELGEESLILNVVKAYRQWKKENKKNDHETEDIPDVEEPIKDVSITLENIQQIAMQGLEGYVFAKNPYEFQELCAALLRGMGYFTPFVAPKGKDGGVDIIAYQDPLGTESPRIKVQVKHRQSTKATVAEVRQLMGLLQKDGDVGIFISSGDFTSDTKTTARTSHVHIELIDMSRFLELWQEFYPKLSDVDKSLLPLVSVYLLEPAV